MIQSKCIKIGLTGGIATGKSTVTNIIRNRGYEVIDADIIARRVVEIGKPAYFEIVKNFGDEILCKDNSINRKKLADLIFNNSELREKLNNIVHPRVFKEIASEIIKLCKYNNIVFLDIPLLFETIESISTYDISFDEVWLVYTDSHIQLRRLMDRDNVSEEEALLKINSQISMDKKMKMATRIIYNNGDYMELERNVDLLLKELEL